MSLPAMAPAPRAGALVISVLLITAPVLDLSRCGIVLVTARRTPDSARRASPYHRMGIRR
ncbi:MAG: hypothetical protein ABR926_19445 [Streptosporangiaceae bacterium]